MGVVHDPEEIAERVDRGGGDEAMATVLGRLQLGGAHADGLGTGDVVAVDDAELALATPNSISRTPTTLPSGSSTMAASPPPTSLTSCWVRQPASTAGAGSPRRRRRGSSRRDRSRSCAVRVEADLLVATRKPVAEARRRTAPRPGRSLQRLGGRQVPDRDDDGLDALGHGCSAVAALEHVGLADELGLARLGDGLREWAWWPWWPPAWVCAAGRASPGLAGPTSVPARNAPRVLPRSRGATGDATGLG